MSMVEDGQSAASAAAQKTRDASRGPERYREWALTALLVGELLILFAAAPVAAMGRGAFLLGGYVLALFLVSALVIVSPDIGARILTIVALILAATGAAVRIHHPSVATIWLGHLASIVALVAISLIIARVVLGPGQVTHHRLQGAVVLYLNVGVMFTSAFRLILERVPTAFANVPPGQSEAEAFASMLYFSLTTLTTTGYGDIVPINPIARGLANLESIIGQLYLAILLARLVTLQIESQRG